MRKTHDGPLTPEQSALAARYWPLALSRARLADRNHPRLAGEFSGPYADALCVAARSWPGSGNFAGYVLPRFRTEYRAVLRKNPPIGSCGVGFNEPAAPDEPPDPSPALADALATLTDRQRDAVDAMHFCGAGDAVASYRLGQHVSTVRQAHRSALRRLRAALTPPTARPGG